MSQFQPLVDQIMSVMDAAFDPAFGEAWNRRQVSEALVLPHTQALVVDERGDAIERRSQSEASPKPAGFVLTRHVADEEELLLIAVTPEQRRRGLAEKLIDRMIANARDRGTQRIFLEMRKGNPAVHLYKKIGFEPIGERIAYYKLSDGNKVDAITFGLDLARVKVT